MTHTFNREFTIDEITVIPSHNKILKNGSEQKIEPKIMQVLCFLVANQGRVISRKEIATQLWPNTVVGVDVITRAIFELRKALNDSAGAPRFIETVARQGYCFIHEVNVDTDLQKERESQSKVADNTSRKSSKLFAFSSVAVVLCVILLASIYSMDAKTPQTMAFVATVLTDESVHAAMPALNQDASKLLFVRDHRSQLDKRELVLLELDSHQERVLQVVDGNIVSPVWLPDSNALLYLRCTNDQCALIRYQLSPADSASRSQELYVFTQNAFSQSLSHDGTEVVVSHQQGADFVLSRYRLGTGEITTLATNTKHSAQPIYDHTGSLIYYLSFDRGFLKGVYSHKMRDGSNTLIDDQFYSIFSIAAKSEDELWIAGKRGGTSGIWSLELPEGKLQEKFVDVAGSFYSDLNASFGKSALVIKKWSRDIDVSIRSFQTLDFQGLSSGTIDYYGRYSSSARSILFVSNRSGTFDIWQADKHGATKLTNLRAASLSEPLLSEEHKRLATIERSATASQLRIFKFSARDKSSVLSAISVTEVPKNMTLLNWSSDKTLLVTLFENDQYVLATVNSQTGKVSRVALNAGLFAKEQDGKLWYVDLKNEKIVVRDEFGTVTPKFDVSALGVIRRPFHMNVVGTDLIYATRTESNILIKRTSASEPEPKTIYMLPDDAVITHLDSNETPLAIYDRRLKDRSAIVMLDFGT